jgi:hypothetical protein
MSEENLKNLKNKLDLLEGRIRDLLTSTEEELKLARKVQALLMPNRLPKFHGLECFAKYVSARELSSEFYDLIASENHRILWIVQSWTSNFGLATLVTQTFMNLQNQKLLGNNAKGDLYEIFQQMLQTILALSDADQGNLRLMIRRLDMSRLSMESLGFGFPPPLVRHQEKNQWGNFQAEGLEFYLKNPGLLKPVSFSEISKLSMKNRMYVTQFKPGQRFYLVGSSWNPTESVEEFFRGLKLDLADGFQEDSASPVPTKDSTLLDDLNYLVLETQRAQKKRPVQADVCIEAFQTDKKLLHLA